MVSELRTVFLVVREPGMAWVRNRGFRDQPGWAEHSAFMDRLIASGQVLFGGPLTAVPHRVVLVVAAESPEAAFELLNQDPWTRDDVLRVASAHAWEWHLAAA
jgi:uncharacterized protein YciI